MSLEFCGSRALAHVEQQVALGPRPPGSEASRQVRHYLREQLLGSGCRVTEQPFLAHTPLGTVPMTNLLGTLPGDREKVLLLAAHYDTLRDFLGADDGASGVGALLELARVLSRERPACQVTFAFLDGEEAMCDWGPRDGLYGSRCLVQCLSEFRQLQRVRAAIVLDMIGDRELRVTRELTSSASLRYLVWQEARRQGVGSLFRGPAAQIEDDHLPFLEAGVASALLTGFHEAPGGVRPRYWHTAEDTLDKLCPESLQAVGRVVEGVLHRLDLDARNLTV
ncbi:MAG: M28 family peptidase [Armatimonadetes bacterium]|nr:M28 family peptidase [Armatimonadota bacterium]